MKADEHFVNNVEIDSRKGCRASADLELLKKKLHSGKSPEEALAELQEQVCGDGEEWPSCRGQDQTETLDDWKLVKIIELGAFISYHTSEEPPLGDRGLDDFARRHLAQGWKQWCFKEEGGELRGERDHNWLTDLDALVEHTGEDSESLSADTVADALGLTHYQSGSRLVALLLRPGTFPSANVPTALDGGTFDAFASWRDLPTGKTWDVGGQVPGVVELVGPEISLRGAHHIYSLGTTDWPRTVTWSRMLARDASQLA